MRIARVVMEGADRLGIVNSAGHEIRLLAPGADLLELLAASPATRQALTAAADASVALSEVVLRTPLDPPAVRDFVTFEEHVEGMGGAANPISPEWYKLPTFYFSNPHGLVATGAEIEIPPGSGALDFELEVAAVIGRAGRNLTVAEADGCIAGYTIFNDWSARDLQFREMQVRLGPCKGKDFATTLGPWLVTADELEPWHADGRLDLDLRVSINGEPYGDDSLANMAWSFAELVAYASRGAWVAPGDIFGSGTCGRGCLAEVWGRRGERVPPPLAPGDEVTLAVEGIGTVTNRITVGPEPVPIGPARPAAHRRPR
jgi:2-keto-4-pentenoate hydratase/2-oxohepta-3-ene-1,7-dioic acid hydratase in catechol pathway